jgi:preprotein translocase subunit SecD
MIVFEKWKIALISVFVLAGAVLASPNVIGNADDYESFIGLKRIKLCLYLQGGSYILLNV